MVTWGFSQWVSFLGVASVVTAPQPHLSCCSLRSSGARLHTELTRRASFLLGWLVAVGRLNLFLCDCFIFFSIPEQSKLFWLACTYPTHSWGVCDAVAEASLLPSSDNCVWKGETRVVLGGLPKRCSRFLRYYDFSKENSVDRSRGPRFRLWCLCLLDCSSHSSKWGPVPSISSWILESSSCLHPCVSSCMPYNSSHDWRPSAQENISSLL